MPVTINGTTGIAGVNGSATTPASQGTDTNTGIFYGTDTVSIATNGTTAVTVDSSQRVGVGVSPQAYKFQIGANNGYNDTLASFNEAGTWTGSGGTVLANYYNLTTLICGIKFNSISATAGEISFHTGGTTERARIDSSGNLLVGVTSTFSAVGVTTTSTFSTAGSASWAGAFQNTNSLPVGVLVRYSTDVNGAGNSFLYCQGNATLRAEIRSNGGLANYSANNANLSDIRTKTDINDAPAYLNKICSIPVRTFKYIDQTHDDLNLGVIAQEVEIVAPELVDTDGFGEIPDDGVPLKAIYQTDLQYALMKCIQELSAKLDAAEARIAALEGAK